MGRRFVPRSSVWKLVSTLLLVTLPLRFVCDMLHNCMGGHLAHDPVWPGYAFDSLWLCMTLFAARRAYAARMPLRGWVVGILVLDLLTLATDVRLPLVTLLPTAWVAMSVRRELSVSDRPTSF